MRNRSTLILIFISSWMLQSVSCDRDHCYNAYPPINYLTINYVDSSGNTLLGCGLQYDPDSILLTLNSDTIAFRTFSYGINIFYDDMLNLNDPVIITLNSTDTDTLDFKCSIIPPGPEECFSNYPITECKYNGVDEDPTMIVIIK